MEWKDAKLLMLRHTTSCTGFSTNHQGPSPGPSRMPEALSSSKSSHGGLCHGNEKENKGEVCQISTDPLVPDRKDKQLRGSHTTDICQWNNAIQPSIWCKIKRVSSADHSQLGTQPVSSISIMCACFGFSSPSRYLLPLRKSESTWQGFWMLWPAIDTDPYRELSDSIRTNFRWKTNATIPLYQLADIA